MMYKNKVIQEGIIESTIPLKNNKIDKGKKENLLLN